MKYYILIKGKAEGPYEPIELLQHGMTPDSYVWAEGMPEWILAKTVVEFTPLFYPSSKPEEEPEKKIPDFEAKEDKPKVEIPKTTSETNDIVSNESAGLFNWRVLSIVATALGSMFYLVGGIPGIFGILNAFKAQALYQSGHIAEAESCNRKAMIFTIISGAIGVTFLFLILIIIACS